MPRQRGAAEPGSRAGTPGPMSVATGWWWPPLLMLALGLWGLGRPGAWTDELATWGATQISWSALVALTQHSDLVMLPYYAAMRVWSHLVGSSDVALRLPSVLATAGACALLAVLGGRVASRRAGLLAGVILALTPAVSRYAQEQRMYAFALLGAVLATLMLHRAMAYPSWPRFALYAGAVVLLGTAHVLALLLLLAHFAAVLTAGRAVLLRWLAACALAAAPLGPFLYASALQRGQVSWIASVGLSATPWVIAGVFGSALVMAVIVGLALFARPGTGPVPLLLGWAVLPVAALWLVSLHSPLFVPRYLLFVVPAWALLAGIGLARLSARPVVVVLLLVGLVGVPKQIEMRAADGHGQDPRAAAAIISQRAVPGDAVAYSLNDARGSWVARDLVAHYVSPQRRPDDVFQVRPQRTDGQLWAAECADVASCLGDRSRIWVVRNGRYEDPLAEMTPAAKQRLLRERYRVETVEHPPGLTIALLVR